MDIFLKPDAVTSSKTRCISVHICRPDGCSSTLADLTVAQQAYVKARKFTGKSGQLVRIPAFETTQSGDYTIETGEIEQIVYGVGARPLSQGPQTDPTHGYASSELQTGQLAKILAGGAYDLLSIPDDWSWPVAAVAWGMGAYKFDRYLKTPHRPAQLLLRDRMNGLETQAIVKGLHLGRDLINTPATDLGPEALQDQAQKLADRYGADCQAIIGDDLLSQNYPMIHAVGRAAHEAPRLVEIKWRANTLPKDAPTLTLVGKGITFDTGGLNMKGSTGMRLMKKDMGGAAHVLALAEMIMAVQLPLNLHVLVAIADNAVAANSFRPGDVLSSRKGLSVEIDNTDAEGRLVLGDALTKASENDPDLIIDFATLTGAARVALGPTLPPFFTNRPDFVEGVMKAARDNQDPLWPMPLWSPYMDLLSSPLADMKNSGSGFAGCVTAALFLQKFIGKPDDKIKTANDGEDGDNPTGIPPSWMHLDVYGWNPTASAAKPAGGEIMGVRAIYHWLKNGGLLK